MINHEELWEQVLEDLETKYDSDTFNELFRPCSSLEIKNGYLVVVTPSSFVKKRINSFFLQQVNQIISNLVEEELIKAKFILASEIKAEVAMNKPEEIKPSRKNINANYNFNNFVVGASNRFAYQMALKVADQPGVAANPLYIFGSVGLGKTHLMEAIGNYILDNNVYNKVLYVKASEFIEDYTKLCNGSFNSDKFNDKYRNLDVLLIDDIQILEIGNKSQVEFFKIFDILYNDNKQIVITSDRPANELNIMPRLTSRFEEGLVVDIQSPNLEHRCSIVRKKLEEAGQDNIDEEVIEFVASKFTSNIRELEGAVNRLTQYCLACNLDFTLENTQEALQALISRENKNRALSSDYYTRIIETVADFYKVTFDDITGVKRSSNIVLPRQIAMYILKDNFGLAYKKIGSFFGGKDHTTVMNSVEKIEKEIGINQDLKLAIETIKKKLNI